MFFHKKPQESFVYNDRKITFQTIKIWIYVSEQTNPALKDHYLMKVLKFCVENIHYSSTKLIIKKGIAGDIHLTMRSWLDRDPNTIDEYSFNGEDVLLDILNNKHLPDLIRDQALLFYNRMSSGNILALRQRDNVIPFRL